MKKSKLINVLKTFNNGEIKSFNDFVSSPFFNKEKVLINLISYLQNYHPSFNYPELEKAKVFEFLYPRKKYNDSLMRNIISDLHRLAEEFLVIINLQSNEFRKGMLMLNEFKNRSLESHFIKFKNKLDSLIEKPLYKNEKYFDMKTELIRLYGNFMRANQDNYLEKNEITQEASDIMTSNFLIKMIYYNLLMINRKAHIENFSLRLNMAEEIETFLGNEGRRYMEIPYIECYYYSFKLFQTGDEKYFFSLKEFVDKKLRTIEIHERKDIYTVLQNYCYTKVMDGNDNFVKELFLLYRQSVESGLLKGSRSYIPIVLFMSITTTGFECGEPEWTEKFINDYINDVKEDIRKDILHFSAALSYYWGKKYELSLSELSKVTSDAFSLKHNIKSLILKNYFDLNETEPFYSHIDSYKHFILKNKGVHNKFRERVNNYIIYSKRLFDLKNRGDAEKDIDIEMLKKEISETTSIINKIWLLKKAGEI